MDKNIGKKLDGRYEITELIGVGGMAEVYKGVDVIDNKTVAIKILKKEYAENEEFLRRFRNESKAIAVLSHPNIVKIYDVGFSEKIQYIVMEYIDGITLKEYIEEEKVLTWKDTVHFVIQILRALQHAHDKGIVHRDIKPQNIMMFTDGTIKVMDFGIAKFAREEGKTATDQAIGSVHYISPEQASGNVTDAKSDIYSVGAMMYEMLAGRKAFDSDNPVAIAVMHMHDIPERPRAINPDIPDGLEEIVLRAMEKKPEDRYATTADMIADIEKFKANPSISFGYYQEEDDTSADDTINFSAPVGNETYPEVADSNDSAFAPVGAAVAAGAGAAAYAGASAAQRYAPPQKPITYKDYYDDEDDDDDDEERSSLVIPVLTAVVVVVIIVAVIFVATMLSGLLKGDKAKNDYKMNDFTGMDYNTAQSKYGNNIKFTVEGYEFDAADENTIIWQSVDPGSEYKKGDTLRVKLSKGQEKTTVPDVVDMNQALADDQLRMKGLKPEIITQSDPVIKENNVIKTEPKAGEEVHKGDTILVYVSMGANTEQIEVESYIGMAAKDAVAIAQYKGLKVKTDMKDSYEDEGKVVEQSIAKGEKVEQGTEIILYISTGVNPEGEIPFTVNFPVDAKGRFVIDFILKGEENRTTTISSSNLIVPEMLSWTQDIKGAGENVLVTVSLTNLNTGANANIGTYYFNFAAGTVEAISEDVDYAFMLVGGFPEPEETVTDPPVEEPPVEEPPVEEPPVVEPPVEEPTSQEPQPGFVPGVDGEYHLTTGEWIPYQPGVNGDWVTQDTGETIWVWY